MRYTVIIMSLTTLAGAAAQASTAQSDTRRTGEPAAVIEFARCRSIVGPQERLACFDQAAAQFEADVAAKRVTILDREGVRRARRSLFGFDTPASGILGKADASEDVAEIDGVVARVQALPQQRYEITLADGARWRTTEASRWEPTTGRKVSIRKAALGSYRIRVEGMPTLRGQRSG